MACNELERRRQEVNDLNVFPVADGDTGDNMAMTMRAVLSELDRINGQMIDDIGRDQLVEAVARAALLGARGNSGVILSQIVRGAAEELASRPGELVDPILVSAAFARAADAAYESVRDPAEGTMLTAVRAMAHRVAQELAHMSPQRLDDGVAPEEQDRLLADVLERALDAGTDAVKRGPEQLAVLRHAGVVDAGAYGLTVIMAGLIAALRGGEDPPELEHGAGITAMYRDLGAHVVDGRRTLNPSTYDILAGIHAVPAAEAIVLPNSPNVILAAERAAELSEKPARVVPTRAQQTGLAALLAFDSGAGAEPNAAAVAEAAGAVATGGVARAARDDASGRFSAGDAVGYAN